MPHEPAWLKKTAFTIIIGSSIVIAFFLGRDTAPLGSTPARPVDPCAEVYQAYKDIQARTDWDSSAILRAQIHLIVDHPDCYDAETVAIAKAGRDLPFQPNN
ncbi:hypothetical protein [Nonomuraea lactucae]|uniref:hypothetical protein n=1 Tax=Nonomuraea lactucae TaxID=2249762 RepID=UPI000DE4938E|nr:hypothetical protein [Nonomuraea lactucae]